MIVFFERAGDLGKVGVVLTLFGASSAAPRNSGLLQTPGREKNAGARAPIRQACSLKLIALMTLLAQLTEAPVVLSSGLSMSLSEITDARRKVS